MASDCKKDITIYFTKSRKIFKKWQLHITCQWFAVKRKIIVMGCILS